MPMLAFDQTTGEIGMGSPQARGRCKYVTGANMVLRTAVDRHSDSGQMLERPVS